MPDRIVLYREPLLAISEDEDELRDEIHVTLVHEIAHYYGIDDDRLHDLGWAVTREPTRLRSSSSSTSTGSLSGASKWYCT